ncbi:hypothetical protein EVAR_29747_1 [Eumeta japonica]|uniref:ATP-dependent DNA helicase n=1 Tax=Eumeta variegata TaxID=151549 RepID=A0A4C1WY03_EUMVA|nr:hypothetical protein EVAR_29747_1 [Eumeta japonica]
MANKVSIEAMNRKVQDLRRKTLLFGGVTGAGDLRQILPVVAKEFSKFLFDVGEGQCPEVNSTHDIELSTGLCPVVADTETLIHSIYDDCRNLNMNED